jgi:two-component system NarL family sensor kinase
LGYAAGRAPAGPLSDVSLRLRGRVALAFFAMAIAAGLVITGMMLSRAFEEQHEIRHRAVETAATLSSAFDQEVTAYRYVLRGLSHSPALLSGDFKAFYEQMKATTVSADSWFLLNDLERQVFNTLRPYGDLTLPRHSAFPDHLEVLDRIRTLRSTVSGRLYGLVKGGVTIALSLRIDGDDGQMKYFITTMLSESRLNAIIANLAPPKGWMVGVFDRKLGSIATARDGVQNSSVQLSKETTQQLAGETQRGAISGSFQSTGQDGAPVLIAFRRSTATDWTTQIEVPMALLNAPVDSVLGDVTLPWAALLLLGGIAALVTTREVEQPLDHLRTQVDFAENSVSELSDQLLSVQEDERQRIARELHDSTAQLLVAANLELMRLESRAKGAPDITADCEGVADLIGKALTELRIFTYLLHPPNLAQDGLQATLQQFIAGFARRTGLEATTVIAREIDDLSDEMQRSILRVVQEALTNVHRHARASRVSVQAKIFADRLIIRIRDNGLGLFSRKRGDGSPLLGVGIRGMNARLQQINGRLMVRSRSTGTVVLAVVRLSRPKPSTILRGILGPARQGA